MKSGEGFSLDENIYCTILTNDIALTEIIGTISNYNIYFRCEDNKWEFTVADDSTKYIQAIEAYSYLEGFKLEGKLSTINLEEIKSIIANCVKEFEKYLEGLDLSYEKRFVAFIDIIGFKNIIAQSVENKEILKEIIEATKELRFEFLKRKHENPAYKLFNIIDSYKTRVHQVSDCIIISKIAHKNGSLQELVLDCAFAIHLLIKHNLLCRGCISYGDVYHTDEYIIGPAYVEAFLGEEKEFVPAVNLSEEVYLMAQSYFHYDCFNPSNKTSEQNYFEKFMLPHSKGKYYIDYFNDVGHIDVEDKLIHYNKLRDIIIKEYTGAEDYKIKAKYLWMIDKFNNSNLVKNSQLESIMK